MSIAHVDTIQITKELAQRQRELKRLSAKRAAISRRAAAVQRKLAKTDAAIVALSYGAGRGIRTRWRHTRGRYGARLAQMIYKVLAGGKMRSTDIADAVRAEGFSLTFPNFASTVTGILLANRNRKLFKRVGRGTYARAE